MWRMVGLALAGGVAIELGMYAITYGLNCLRRKPTQKPVLFKTLFFPDNRVACKDYFTLRHGCSRTVCKFSHDDATAYGQLLQCLSSAKRCVDVAVFCITGRELVTVLAELHSAGVIVRVITDDEQVDAASSQVGYLRSQGIQVRHDQSTFYMHHKFAVIDNHTLINGSFNWTRNAITGNNENLIITNQTDIVQAFKKEYEKLWVKFDPRLQIQTK